MHEFFLSLEFENLLKTKQRLKTKTNTKGTEDLMLSNPPISSIYRVASSWHVRFTTVNMEPFSDQIIDQS